MNDEQLIWEAYQKNLKENMQPEESMDPSFVKAKIEQTINELKKRLSRTHSPESLQNINTGDVAEVRGAHKTKFDYYVELENYVIEIVPELDWDGIYTLETDEWVGHVTQDPSIAQSLKRLVDEVKRLGILAYTEDYIQNWRETRDFESDERSRESQYRKDVNG
jgi:hypothetical protein